MKFPTYTFIRNRRLFGTLEYLLSCRIAIDALFGAKVMYLLLVGMVRRDRFEIPAN